MFIVHPTSPHRVSFRSLFCLISLALALAAPVSSGQGHPAASRTVEELHQLLLDVMHNADSLDYQGRYQRLEPFIRKNFDTPLITRTILGRRYWEVITEQQQADFIDLFNRLSTATYASRFDSWDGEEFVEIAQEELNKGRLLLKTELRRSTGSPVRLDYLMHGEGEDWLIISVIADGVNDLSLKRAEYATIIKEKGFDGLVTDIEQKIRDLEHEPD